MASDVVEDAPPAPLPEAGEPQDTPAPVPNDANVAPPVTSAEPAQEMPPADAPAEAMDVAEQPPLGGVGEDFSSSDDEGDSNSDGNEGNGQNAAEEIAALGDLGEESHGVFGEDPSDSNNAFPNDVDFHTEIGNGNGTADPEADGEAEPMEEEVQEEAVAEPIPAEPVPAAEPAPVAEPVPVAAPAPAPASTPKPKPSLQLDTTMHSSTAALLSPGTPGAAHREPRVIKTNPKYDDFYKDKALQTPRKFSSKFSATMTYATAMNANRKIKGGFAFVNSNGVAPLAPLPANAKRKRKPTEELSPGPPSRKKGSKKEESLGKLSKKAKTAGRPKAAAAPAGKKATPNSKLAIPSSSFLETAYPPPAQTAPAVDRKRGLKHCAAVLKKTMAHGSAWPFKVPVDPVALNLPDYWQVVKNPMDLGTIESKLKQKKYKDDLEFEEDVRLVFYNCRLYNPAHDPIRELCDEVEAHFDELFNAAAPRAAPARAPAGGYAAPAPAAPAPKKKQSRKATSGRRTKQTLQAPAQPAPVVQQPAAAAATQPMMTPQMMQQMAMMQAMGMQMPGMQGQGQQGGAPNWMETMAAFVAAQSAQTMEQRMGEKLQEFNQLMTMMNGFKSSLAGMMGMANAHTVPEAAAPPKEKKRKKAGRKSTSAVPPKRAASRKRNRSKYEEESSSDFSSSASASGDEDVLSRYKPMEFNEKKKLSGNINKLPTDRLPKVLEIIRGCMPSLSGKSQDDFVEVDIDQLDDKTLRTLEKYVDETLAECQKKRKKKKKRDKEKSASARADSAAPPAKKMRTEAPAAAAAQSTPAAAATRKSEATPMEVSTPAPRTAPTPSAASRAAEPAAKPEDAAAAAAASVAASVPKKKAEVDLKSWASLVDDEDDAAGGAEAAGTASAQPSTPAAADPSQLWSQFQTRDTQQRQREQERAEEEARLKREEEEARRREAEEAERRRKEEEARVEREREEQRLRLQAEREASRAAMQQDEATVDMNEQRDSIASLEQMIGGGGSSGGSFNMAINTAELRR